MSDPGLGESVKGLSSSLDKVLDKLNKIDGVAARLNKRFRSMGSTNFGANGTGNTGAGTSFTVGGNDATFSGFMDTLSDMSSKLPGGKASVLLGTGFKVAGNTGNMMPDVNATMTRMAQGYNAAVMNGYSGANNAFRSQMQSSTLAMMRNGLTSPGSDVQFANIMASSGIAFNANYNSTYNQNARQVAGLAKYLNVDNATAAQSMADLTSGATSSMLMRNLGIMTSDPMSGKMYSFKDIAEQFESRITKGGKITEEGVMDSYHRGFLGVSLQNSGFDPLQQQMILQDLLSKAKTGKGIDWANTKEMDRLAKDNPMLSQYKMNYSDTRQMQKGEGAYKTGIDTAVGGLTKLNEIAGDLAATFGSLKSGVDTFLGHRAGAGFVQNILDIGSGIMQLRGGSSSTISMSSSGGMSSISGIGRSSGGYSSRGGGTTSTTGVDSPDPGPTPTPASTTTGAGSTSSNQKRQAINVRFTCIKPVKGGRVITDYGVRGKRWAGGIHKALDWDVPEGTPVVAAHDGIAHTFPTLSSEIGYHIKVWWTGAGSDRTYATQYCHLSRIVVGDGQSVKQGDLIGYSGQTGTNCDGPHLHFEVWKNGDRVNPHDYISGEASGSPTTASGSAGYDSGSPESTASGGDLPISLTANSQISMSKGTLSSTGSTDYYSAGGGGSSSTTGIDVSSPSGYSTSRPGKNYLTTSASNSQTHPLVNGTSSAPGSKPNVVINLTISKATDIEAKKFAERVKDYLQEDRLISTMGRS